MRVEGLKETSDLSSSNSATQLVLDRIVEGSQLIGRRNPDALLECAQLRGALPLVRRRLREHGEDTSSSSVAWRSHVLRLALYRRELARVLGVLERISPVVVLKGEPLAKQLYGDGQLRSTTDMDLLVEPGRVGEAARVLEPLGYVPMYVEEAKTWTSNQAALVHCDYGTIVELHWRIAFPHQASPAAEELFERTVAVEMGGFEVQTLRPEMLLLQLCYHFHQHLGFLKGLLDISGWIDRFEETADLGELERLARELGVWGMVQWPLHALQIFTGYRSRLYDPDVDAFVRGWAMWTAAKLERDFVELRAESGVERWLGEQSFGAKAATALAQGASMLVADGVTRKVLSGVSPVVLGPHRLGRAVFGALEKAGVVDREELFVGRVLGS